MAVRRRFRRRVRRAGPIVRRTPSSLATAARIEAKQTTPGDGGLMIGGVHDPAEKAADQVADRVLPSSEGKGQEDMIRNKTAPNVSSAAAGAGPVAASADVTRSIRSLGCGKPLDRADRAFFEPRLGTDLSSVRIHDGSAADRASQGMQARAFTLGNDIAFARGEHQPGTQIGRRLLAHELAHTLEHGRGNVRPKIRRAMKFEYQIKKNRLYRDDGRKVLPLPRKYGPQDFLVKGNSGVRLESETKGQPEFETGWTRTWSKLRAQIDEAYGMTKKINAASDVEIDGVKFKAFPFSKVQTTHLRRGAGFRFARNPKAGKRTKRWAKKQKAKRYESNTNQYDFSGKKKKRVLSRDTVMGKKERLLVKVRDSDWNAYIQSSESFSLEQFESFLKEHRSSSEVDPVVRDAGRVMSAQNPNKRSAIVKPNQTHLSKLIEHAVADLANQQSDRDFNKKFNSLRNFLLMVLHYIKMGAENPVKGKPAKFALHLMSRTDFGSIYKSLPSDKERELFNRMVNDNVNGILPMLGVDKKALFFVKGHGGEKSSNPTVFKWLKGITEGKDLLKGRGFPAAMGRFKVDQETKKHEGLIRYETRKTPGNSEKASGWAAHALDLFESAMLKRARDSGKGKTGLRLK